MIVTQIRQIRKTNTIVTRNRMLDHFKIGPFVVQLREDDHDSEMLRFDAPLDGNI